MLTLNNVSKSYPQGANKKENALVLDSLSADYNASRICITGANGTGKSTLLLIIAGLLAADNGDIIWHSSPQNLNQRKQLAALASDSVVIPAFLTARQTLKLTQDIWQANWPQHLIEQFSFTSHLDKTIDSLSTGSLKKLQLISAFMRQPVILLLDEPNIALDEKSLQALWMIIENYPHKIIVASNEPQLFKSRYFAIHPLHVS